jgi:hypothetical protein
MGRKMIIVSDDNDFIVSAKNFCESKGGSVKAYTPAEWAKQVNNPSFVHSLMGGVPPLSVGKHPVTEGAKILQFPYGDRSTVSAADRVATMNELESVAIQNAIQSFNGNLTEAAKALGIGRATLYRKVKQYNFDPSAARRKKAA